jgi:hypothetical protein
MASREDNSAMALLGLTEYEGKLYRALLVEFPATAYQLGKRSGVPLSRVYEVAARLVEKGAATLLTDAPDAPARYTPVPPEMLVETARRHAVRSLDTLSAELGSLFAGSPREEPIWVRGETAVCERVAVLLTAASESVLLAVTASARERLEPMPSVPSGVLLRVLTLPATARGDFGLVVLQDGQRALFGRLGTEADAFLSTHPTFVRLCEDYFRLRSLAEAVQESRAPSLTALPTVPPRPAPREPGGWMDWEEEKQRRLLQIQ